MIKCSESPDSWQVIGHTVRPKNDKKLCWTRRGESGIRLMECDEEEGKGKWADQRFEGVCMNKPHKIRPLADKKWCLTSGHEPRSEEQIKFQVSTMMWACSFLLLVMERLFIMARAMCCFGRPNLDVWGQSLFLSMK